MLVHVWLSWFKSLKESLFGFSSFNALNQRPKEHVFLGHVRAMLVEHCVYKNGIFYVSISIQKSPTVFWGAIYVGMSQKGSLMFRRKYGGKTAQKIAKKCNFSRDI